MKNILADVELDMNGKWFSWQAKAICKLPFIEETSLLSEVARVENTLTEEESQRNKLGMDVLFVHVTYPLAKNIVSFYRSNIDHPNLISTQVKQDIDPESSGGMNGYIFVSNRLVQPVQIDSPISGMDMIADNKVLSVFYKCPAFHVHIPRPPSGVHYPNKSILKKHVKPTPLFWHEKSAVVGWLHSLR
ncbi:5'-3' exoribonuclease 4-like [Humulus lupulus]|uniref:5'-3' exoribonuclease 4-like n=1 Tax=Humulus lupulus TaxID=3486 RepID=UPI002B4134E1|nr:5'-3' exoribonuclease 4-like [Humulus lupulus]